MEYLKQYLSNSIVLFIVIGILLLTNIGTVSYFLYFQEEESCVCEECPEIPEVPVEEKQEVAMIKVDIKGYVKKPGVYEVQSGAIVNDLIQLAGGLKTNGTTDNINLSKQLNNEDMIVVLSKSELSKIKATSTQIATTNSSSNVSSSALNDATSNATKKVSLNTATKEELMTLNGIGEAKALSILEYRSQKAFTDIREIMNVSGIGESVYEKIKDNITI